QKPFVLDIDEGQRLVDLADAQGVKLAVNHNGRWAPHFSYMRQAIARGRIGQVQSVLLSVHWDHSWVCGTEFENVKHLILYDFGIHWFDIVSCFLQKYEAQQVHASIQRSATQKARPAMLAHALIDFDGAQATLAFNGDTKFGPQDQTYLSGTEGTLTSTGPDLMQQRVTLYNREGFSSPALEGHWFPDGFHGAMAELLCAIEENREPLNSARGNLRTLELCFAAVYSAEEGRPVKPGECRKLMA
ncbi:MAG: Gfo/Idh/MocA family oxidoreductase, partial [Anaerolineae bacterium]|nr:Gfo/Idh/MocA family oxidoreductase [Anaerolineae bacterium]